MGLAVHVIEEIPQYQESGDVCIVCGTNLIVNIKNIYLQWDARHNSTADAYHTTVPCLSGRFAFTCK